MADGFGLAAERETSGLRSRGNGTGGLGLAPQIAQAVPREPPREIDTGAAAAAAVPARRRRRSAIPSFADNPLGAIGLVLTEFARGLKGQPSAIPGLRQKDIEAAALEMRQSAVRLNALKLRSEAHQRDVSG